MPGIQSIEGITSGWDITSIVDTIIDAERTNVNYLQTDKEYKTQQMAAYAAVEAKFLAVQTAIAQMKRADAFQQAIINISDDTVVSGVADGVVGPGSYALRVLQVARNHQIASQGFDDPTDNIFGTGTIKLSTGDAALTTINIDESVNNLVDIKDAINDADLNITATIINDGSSSNPYRLLLTSDKTGVANEINFEISMTGGEAPDFTGTSFDSPEMLSVDDDTTSSISLGGTASYSGSENKIYTFTVAGNGQQTLGSDVIRIDWTDGTNSGSILVTQSDTEVELLGDGADGLKLSFSAGDLTAGDTFQVGTFAPLLQSASDARVAIGSDDPNAGSAIVINSDTNTFKDVVPGVTLTTHKVTDDGETISIDTDRDIDGIKGLVENFIDKYNDLMDFIDDQFTYDSEANDTGVLFTEFSLQAMQSTTRSTATSFVSGLSGDYKSLGSIGIRTDGDGKLKLADTSKLITAIEEDFNKFLDLFVDSGESTSSGISFATAGSNAVPGSNYDINITQAAEKGYFQGAEINDPSVSPITLTSENNIIKLLIDGIESDEISLSEKTYTSGSELAAEIQLRIDANDELAERNISVEWVDNGDSGYLKITSGSYGSGSSVNIKTSVENSAFMALGLAAGTNHSGKDVEGTINGEKATGNGQYLTGDEDNATTDGLKLKITLSASDLGTGAEGSISFVRGLAAKIGGTLENITDSIDGSIARRTAALKKQIEDLDDQIAYYEERFEARRAMLYDQFLAMEEALSQSQTTAQYLSSQLSQISNNWNSILG